jgi:hypothetical protein
VKEHEAVEGGREARAGEIEGIDVGLEEDGVVGGHV